MAVRHRRRGEVEAIFSADGPPGVGGLADFQRERREREAARKLPHFTGDGLQITLRAIPGHTNPAVLKTPFAFQCPPLETFAREGGFEFAPYTTIRKGQFNRPNGVTLETIQFDTVFVSEDASYTVTRHPDSGPNPVELVSRLDAIRRRGTPFELMIGQRRLWRRLDVHWGPLHENAAVITNCRVEERHGEVDARYVNISFQEYRDPHLLRKGIGEGAGKGTRGRDDLPVKLTVEAGTGAVHGVAFKGVASLVNFAKHFYGEASMWRAIAKRNGGLKGVAPSDNLAIAAGRQRDKRLTIVIPALQTKGFAPTKGSPGSGDTLHGE